MTLHSNSYGTVPIIQVLRINRNKNNYDRTILNVYCIFYIIDGMAPSQGAH